MFNVSKVWNANHESQSDIVINQGGTDSGKTYAIMQLLFWYAITTDAPKIDPVITIVGESIPNLKKGAYRAAEGISASTPGLKYHIINWNKTDRIINFKKGWIMEFISCETEQSAKNGKRQYLFVNEANGISYRIFWQLAKRTRKKVFIDYNPSAPFWSHEKLIGTTETSNDFGKTVELIISDHRHNPFLTEQEHNQTENIADKELWKVYARGLTGNLQGLIFPKWKMIKDEDFPDIDFFGGLDFGYTNDPTAGVKIAVVGNNVFIHELCYLPGIAPIQMKEIFKANGFTESTHVYCEHDPEQISQLRRLKVMALMARKGNGSIKAGILKLNEYNVFYTESSKNLHIEKTKYMWEIDKVTGKPTNEPQSGFDHLMDAIRYGVYTKFYRQ
ncbi:MAG: terminase family protein [Bacteroidota bacterium]